MLSDAQRRMMKHALGWPKMYRNHYAAPVGTDTFEIWEGLARDGLAERYDELAPLVAAGGLACFVVTPAGREALRDG